MSTRSVVFIGHEGITDRWAGQHSTSDIPQRTIHAPTPHRLPPNGTVILPRLQQTDGWAGRRRPAMAAGRWRKPPWGGTRRSSVRGCVHVAWMVNARKLPSACRLSIECWQLDARNPFAEWEKAHRTRMEGKCRSAFIHAPTPIPMLRPPGLVTVLSPFLGRMAKHSDNLLNSAGFPILLKWPESHGPWGARGNV